MTENIVQGPWPMSMRPGKSAHAIEIERVERDFRTMRRRDDDVFQCLAAKMDVYLTEVEVRGLKSGSIGRIIGGDTDGTARHRSRFSWNGEPRDFKKHPLSKNPGHWLAVLRRCAEELQRPPNELLLDAFSGSRIRPSAVPTDFVQASWIQSFVDLMMHLEDRLCGQPEVTGLLDYIAAALLEFDDDDNLVEADDAILPSFRADIPDWPEMLVQLPSTQTCFYLIGGYSYLPGPSMDPREAQAWSKLIEGCQATLLAETHRLSLVTMVQRGLAIIPGGGAERPRLSLYKYPKVELLVSDIGVNFDENSRTFPLPPHLHPAAGEILFPSYPDYPPHLVGRVSFAPLGSEAFNVIAAESLAKYDSFAQYLKSDGGGCWDPMYTDDGASIDWASSAPKATVAAMIERNLLFADEAGVPDERLDRLLQAELDRMVAAVRQHREHVDQIVAPARRNLLAEWSESSPRPEGKTDG